MFAFGCTLFRMAAEGKHPYLNISCQCRGEPNRRVSFKSSSTFENVFVKLLETDPDKRATAAKLRSMFEVDKLIQEVLRSESELSTEATSQAASEEHKGQTPSENEVELEGAAKEVAKFKFNDLTFEGEHENFIPNGYGRGTNEWGGQKSCFWKNGIPTGLVQELEKTGYSYQF